MTGAAQATAQVRQVRSSHFSDDSRSTPVWFDPQRRAASGKLKAATAGLARELEAQERALGLRQRARMENARRGFRLALEALACNLASLCMMHLWTPLAVPRSSGVMWAKSRYSSPVFGQHFLDALHLMAHPEIDLIEDVARGFKFAGSAGQQSTVRATNKFAAWCLSLALTWPDFTRAEEPEVLVLRGAKDRSTGEAEAIDYKDTALTRKRRNQVQRINRYLFHAPISIASDEPLLGFTEDGRPIDLTRRTVRRIFNNGSWKQGGRLYDAFWETMPREDRFKFLRIRTTAHPEGESIANVDHAQLFPRLAYVQMNRIPPEGDLYDIDGQGSHREGYKRLVNALLLSNKMPRNWPKGMREDFPPGARLRNVVNAIEERHAPIAHLFGTGAGFRLMLIESEILVDTLLTLYAQGVTALPLHDSVLVAASDARLAERAMHASFERSIGCACASLKTTFAEEDERLSLLRLL
jgi:hypothetical protein